jgi:hypothetical protein
MAASGYQVLLREALVILFFPLPFILTEDTDTDIGVGNIFQIPQGKEDLGTCNDSMTTLQNWFAESKTMLNAGLQAFADAADTSSPNYEIARYYLVGHWRLTPSSEPSETTDVTGKEGPRENQTKNPYKLRRGFRYLSAYFSFTCRIPARCVEVLQRKWPRR